MLGGSELALVPGFGKNHKAAEVSETVVVKGCHLSSAFVLSVDHDLTLGTGAFAGDFSDLGRRDRIRVFAQVPNQAFRVLQVALQYGLPAIRCRNEGEFKQTTLKFHRIFER